MTKIRTTTTTTTAEQAFAQAMQKMQQLRDAASKPAESSNTRGSVTINGEEFTLFQAAGCLDPSPVFVSENLTAKMSGVPAIGTTCAVNEYCLGRMKAAREALERGEKASICAYCFAEKGHYTAQERGARNYAVLNAEVLPFELLPVFANVLFVRIEWGGDLGSVTQARNYIRIARKNPRVTFAWWSKNLHFIDEALRLEGGKPDNIIFVQSSAYINEEEAPAYKWVDKVFTVYESEEKAAELGAVINCGARSCARCRRCYTHAPGVEYVHELLK